MHTANGWKIVKRTDAATILSLVMSILAAASALGKMVIRLGKHQGFRTINVVRRADQLEELGRLGADAVIDASQERVEERVAAIKRDHGRPALVRLGIDKKGRRAEGGKARPRAVPERTGAAELRGRPQRSRPPG